MKKRVSCRAIIFDDQRLVTMHRIWSDREYYTFPGGGVEEGEDLATCVKREVLEEFGLEVDVVRMVYEYHSTKSLQYFFLCRILGGVYGTGTGPEMVRPYKESGAYIPSFIPLDAIEKYPLEPRLVVEQFKTDYQQFGENLSEEIQIFEDPTY